MALSGTATLSIMIIPVTEARSENLPSIVGAGVGLGEAEAAHPLAAAQLRQVGLALRLGAEVPDRVHHQRRLHREGRAIAGIHPLHLARDQAVAHVVDAGAAIAFERGAEK